MKAVPSGNQAYFRPSVRFGQSVRHGNSRPFQLEVVTDAGEAPGEQGRAASYAEALSVYFRFQPKHFSRLLGGRRSEHLEHVGDLGKAEANR